MNARELALAVVRDVFPAPGARVRERGAQESLDYRARKSEASARERAFATELAYGSIKMRRALEWYLRPFTGEQLRSLPAATAEILRLAAYELIYTRADEHATVFEFVNLAKRYGHRGLANLVNAVLRSFLRDRPGPPTRVEFENDDEYLGSRFSLPDWLVRCWREPFGERTQEVCGAVNDPARTAIVVNRLKSTPQDAAVSLREAGVATTPSSIVEEVLLVDEGGAALAALGQAAQAQWWLQSESSAMAVDLLAPQPGDQTLDVCSGRGNKALQIAARLAGDGGLICLERDPRKSEALAGRLDRASVAAAIVTGDATGELLPAAQRFDRVLVDAPCSGIGTVGRHPEARWKKRATDGERLAMTQRALLERAASYVRDGGTLLYAVCSNDPRETNAVVESLLATARFERTMVPSAYAAFATAEGDLAVPPGIGGRDGFFFARLERR